MSDEVLMAVAERAVEEPAVPAQAPPDLQLASRHHRVGCNDDEVEAVREFQELTVFISASELEAILAR